MLFHTADAKPIRFEHIGLTAQTSITSLLKLIALRDVRASLETLDGEITSLRETINPPGSSMLDRVEQDKGKYDDIDDVDKLERLVKAKEKTKTSLEGRVGWASLERARAEDLAA